MCHDLGGKTLDALQHQPLDSRDHVSMVEHSQECSERLEHNAVREMLGHGQPMQNRGMFKKLPDEPSAGPDQATTG